MKSAFIIGLWRFNETTNIRQLRSWSKRNTSESQYHRVEVRPAEDDPSEPVLKFHYRFKPTLLTTEEDVKSFVFQMARSLRRSFGDQLLAGKIVFGAEQAIQKRTIVFA